ncbi:MAG: hypothetical protein KIT40_12175 [Nitrospira sp.]|nr:hypothetical protein [Nitrospira sp.]
MREIIDVQSKDQDYSGALQAALLGTDDGSFTDYALGRIAARQAALTALDEAMER